MNKIPLSRLRYAQTPSPYKGQDMLCIIMSILKIGRLASIRNAKYLRQNQTPEEKMLWSKLRGHRFQGFKFKRQQPIGPYIADFICIQHRLIIEADGSHHDIDTDAPRDAFLRENNYRVLRISNFDIKTNMAYVMDNIWIALHDPEYDPQKPV